VFVNSESDLFHEDVPFDYVDKVFAVMALCQQHTFQILTKRPQRMAEYFRPESYPSLSRGRLIGAQCEEIAHDWPMPQVDKTHYRFSSRNIGLPLPNVWLGTSVENQPAADERIQYLLQCRATVLFLSCEPLLGPIQLAGKDIGGTLWIGGERGCDGMHR